MDVVTCLFTSFHLGQVNKHVSTEYLPNTVLLAHVSTHQTTTSKCAHINIPAAEFKSNKRNPQM